MEKISKVIRKKGLKLLRQERIKKDVETEKRIHFLVKGETEEHIVIYDKILDRWSCDCRYFALKERTCSHIYGSKIFLKKIKKIKS
jgi:hypothetical protein